MTSADWYFDFVSPFAYLSSESLHRVSDRVAITPRPILFAGLLKHWDTKGPAEIPEMRRFTFRHITWLAKRNNIPLKLPPAHPFNPLKLLRLAIACDASLDAVQHIFRFVWRDGSSSDNPEHWNKLTAELGIRDADVRVASDSVKRQLVEQTQQAIEHGVFGVPTYILDGEIFWGFDAIDFVFDYLDDPNFFSSPDMQSVDAMPIGVARR